MASDDRDNEENNDLAKHCAWIKGLSTAVGYAVVSPTQLDVQGAT